MSPNHSLSGPLACAGGWLAWFVRGHPSNPLWLVLPSFRLVKALEVSDDNLSNIRYQVCR